MQHCFNRLSMDERVDFFGRPAKRRQMRFGADGLWLPGHCGEGVCRGGRHPEWIETLGSERLTGALLDRITHHVSILEMNGDSYRLAQSRAKKAG
jgi:hypothetical protein